MHKYFAEWYRAAGVDPKAGDLEQRWQGVEGFAKDLNLQNGLELVRLFYGRPPQSASFVDEYSAVFQAIDRSFPMRDNGLELQVLAGATIAHVVQTTRSVVADALALGMLCGYCQGLRQKVVNGEIIEYARNYLVNESVKVRDIDEDLVIKVPDVNLKNLLDALTAASTGSSLTVLQEPIKAPFVKLADAIKELSSSINDMAGKIAQEIDSHRENSDILWWVFGEHSRDLNKRMSELPLPFAALIAGKELADLVRVIPGPLAAPAFLDKMLRFADSELSKPTSIKDGVNVAPQEWRQQLIEGRGTRRVQGLCPVHLAIQKSLEFDKATQWLAPFEKAAEIKSKSAITPLDLAIQVYQERMLMRAVDVASSS